MGEEILKLKKMKNYLIIVLVSFLIFTAKSQTKNNLIKIVAEDRAAYNCFGWTTSIFGNYCVVGTPQKGGKELNGHKLFEEVGGAYIFKKNIKGNWMQTQLLLPDKPKECDFFGGSVSLYDNYLAVGCNGDDTISGNSHFLNRMGAVYMFKIDNLGKWNKAQKITLKKRSFNDNFGEEVCLYKKKLAVSSFKKNNGSVYIFEQNAVGGWIQTQTIECPKAIEFFGYKISMADSLIIISSMMSETVFVYQLTQNNKWDLIRKLNATNKSDIDFGHSLAIKNNILCVGASGSFERSDKLADNPDTLAFRKKNLLGAGSVYIYEIGVNNEIKFKQRITAKDIKADMHFGMCISMSDSLLVVGAFGDALDIENLPDNRYGGAAYIFKQNTMKNWIETKKITSPKRSIWDKFAFSVSAFNQTVIIGSRFEEEDAQEKQPINDAGAAYIYEDK